MHGELETSGENCGAVRALRDLSGSTQMANPDNSTE